MSNTNEGLVRYAKKAYKEGWGYCLGTYGQILTRTLLNQKKRQGYGVGAYNTRHSAYLERYIGKMVSDCYGLVKGYVWKKDSRGSAIYNARQDRNQEGAYRAAREKGPISNMPEIPGLVLWMKGHAGIYIGNGEFIEIAGVPVGMRKGRIVNGRVVKGARFTNWFKDTYIDYSSTPSRGDKPIGSNIEQLAKDVIAGKYGVGAERKRKLGSNYSAVQKRVNEILKGSPTPSRPATTKTWNGYIAGNEIKKLQSELNRQFNRGLAVDGLFGNDTINATVNVRQGARGNLTRIIQERLNVKGYNLSVDGIFGAGTNKIVKQFQQRNNLAADGIVGTNTWKALYKI